MKYTVVTDFFDVRDWRYAYKKGDTYPRKGLEVSAERIKQLMTPTESRGALIAEIPEADVAKNTTTKTEKAIETPKKADDLAKADDQPVEKKETAKKPTTKKTTSTKNK